MLEIWISSFARNGVELGIFLYIRGSLLRGSGVMSLAQHADLPCGYLSDYCSSYGGRYTRCCRVPCENCL